MAVFSSTASGRWHSGSKDSLGPQVGVESSAHNLFVGSKCHRLAPCTCHTTPVPFNFSVRFRIRADTATLSLTGCHVMVDLNGACKS